MSEEWGCIVIKVSSSIAEAFDNNNYAQALTLLAETAGVGLSVLGSIPLRFDEVTVYDNYVLLSYEEGNWSHVSQQLLQQSNSIEYYACHYDEYGLETYVSLHPDNKPIFIQCDHEADDDVDSSQKQQWIQAVPVNIQTIFPQLIEEESEDE